MDTINWKRGFQNTRYQSKPKNKNERIEQRLTDRIIYSENWKDFLRIPCAE